MHEAVAVVALVACLASVLEARFRGREFIVAAIAVALVLATRTIGVHDAWHQVQKVGPVVGFLAAVLTLADGCDHEGLFAATGQRLSRHVHSASGLLGAVALLGAVTTAVLSLDTTVVLLTPVVLSMARSAGRSERPSAYLVGHLANSASLLLPVSNLTNLLALSALGISFSRFAGLMALPWLAVIGIEYVTTARLIPADERDLHRRDTTPLPIPRFALTVVVLTVAGFTVSSVLSIAPVWFAAAGALVLSAYRLAKSATTPRAIVVSAAPSFCLWVLGLTIVTRGVSVHGLSRALRHLIPAGHGLLVLLAVAGLSALVANLINNLPATLLLLPVVALNGVGPLLAMLVGVNVGPNLSYPGSLATLLWRRAVADLPDVPRWREFVRLGAVTVPLGLVVAVLLLRLSLTIVGS